MKPVATTDLLNATPEDAFRQTVADVQHDANAMVRKTFTLRQRDVERINAEATSLSASQKRIVNASEALRHILDGSEG